METNNNSKTTADQIVAQALETALSSKVEKEDGAGLMTDAERAKLAGLENYTLPAFNLDIPIKMTPTRRSKVTPRS